MLTKVSGGSPTEDLLDVFPGAGVADGVTSPVPETSNDDLL